MSKSIMTIMMFLIPSTVIFAEEMTPLQLLGKYKANRDLLSRHITQSDEVTESIDSAEGNKPTWSRDLIEFRTDGKRVGSTIKMWRDLTGPDDKGSDKKLMTKNIVWDGETWYEFIPNNKWAFISKKEQHKNEFVSYGYMGSSLDGYFWGDFRRVDDILAQTPNINLRPQTEKVNGVDCYIVDADTTYGKYSLWIDPQHGYNIAKANVYKSGDDMLYGKPISQHKKPEIPEGSIVGKIPERINEFSFSIDNVKFQKVGEGWVPVEAEYQFTEQRIDGQVVVEKKNHKRVQIDPNPDFEAMKAFVPDIPDGTNITIEGIDGIGYRWLQGKPVPNIDKSFFAQLDDVTQEIKSDIKETIVTKTGDSNKITPATGEKPLVTPNPKDVEQKDTYKLSSFSVSAMVLAGVIVIGIGGYLVFRLARRRNHAGD
jgi:hypothetical protein